MHREIDRKQNQLFSLAAVFLGIFSLSLTIAPSVRARAPILAGSSQNHWLGYFVWLGLFWLLNRSSKKYLPKRDPYLLPIIALMSVMSGCSSDPTYSDAITDAPAASTLGNPTISVTGWGQRPMKDEAVGVMPGARITVTPHFGNLTSVVVSGPNGKVDGHIAAN